MTVHSSVAKQLRLAKQGILSAFLLLIIALHETFCEKRQPSEQKDDCMGLPSAEGTMAGRASFQGGSSCISQLQQGAAVWEGAVDLGLLWDARCHLHLQGRTACSAPCVGGRELLVGKRHCCSRAGTSLPKPSNTLHAASKRHPRVKMHYQGSMHSQQHCHTADDIIQVLMRSMIGDPEVQQAPTSWYTLSSGVPARSLQHNARSSAFEQSGAGHLQ